MSNLDAKFRVKDDNGLGLSKNNYSDIEKASLANKISKTEEIIYTDKISSPGLVNGATVSGNIITIPVGQTGNQTFFGFYQQSSADINILKEINCTITIVVNNYLELTQPVVFNVLNQKFKAGSFVSVTTNTTATYTESIIGSTLTRIYSIKKSINQSDIDNQYYYNFLLQINNSQVVSNNVTITVSGDLKYTLEPNKYINQVYSETLLYGNANGAVNSGNIVTIPVNSTGNSSYYGFQQLNANGLFLGQTIKTKIVVEINNYQQLTQPINFIPRSQRYKAGVFQTNTTPTEVNYFDSITGNVLTRTYNLTQVITQSDIDNSYYYYYIIQLQNTNVLSSSVTLTLSGNLTYRIDIPQLATKLSDTGTVTSAIVDKSIRNVIGLYNGYITKSIKKDGTGDFTSIQAAIDSITDASSTNQYELLVYDDFYYTSRTQLSGGAIDSTTQSYVFKTKDYVSIRGVGSTKTIQVLLPNNVSGNDLIYTQVAYHAGFSRLENLNFVIKNGRYAIHTEGGGTGDADDFQTLINCNLNHLGNQDATNFASWKSDCAWGFGNSSGQRVIAKGCNFIARKQSITYHTNVTYINPTHLKLVNCTLTEREESTLGSTDYTRSLNAAELGSGLKHTVELVGCTLNNHFEIGGSWYLNTTNRNDAFSQFWFIKGHSNSPFSIKLGNVNVLKLTTVANGASISVTGGTAKSIIYGNEYLSKTGASDTKGVCVGTITIEPTTNNYITNYMATLGHRLGDCSSINKTLIVTVNGTPTTITFDKNYSGGSDKTIAPAYSASQILTEINTVLSGIAVATDNYVEFYPDLSDTYIIAKNSTSSSILPGMGVIFTSDKGIGYVRKATAGEKIDGIALSEIQAYNAGFEDSGKVLLYGKMNIEKWQFFAPYNYNPGYLNTDTIFGKMLKIGSTAGGFIETTDITEAILIGKDKETWQFVNQSPSRVAVTGLFSDINSKPTTIAGYGITDYNTLGDARYAQLSTANTLAGNLTVNAFGQFGTSTEKLSISGVDIGFNRNTQSGAIYNNTVTAYQWRHTSSTTLANDYLALQRYNSSGSFQNYPISFNGNGTVGINTVTQDNSAQLDVSSTTRGALLPRMTVAQRNAIASPVAGLEIYCTDAIATDTSTGVKQCYNGSSWKNYW